MSAKAPALTDNGRRSIFSGELGVATGFDDPSDGDGAMDF
jgi:hypothetical protein